ncbi:winged helix-turn-helix transcriptional regulator [Paracoccus caeni]|uniref:winged helix-turn-helix transcriptional regulator n=1 Tax=Paracoccus caeni TaxID=657651 RepID=UPI002D7E70AE|nr:helix-turn-helix domain-containing protein [Paracoccus caeni]
MTKADPPLNPWNVFKVTCPTRQVLNCITDKWAVLVVGCLLERDRRSGELRREIEGISQKMLTQTLRALERDGLVRREVFPSVPPRVDYTLTPLGRSLGGIVDQLREWSEQHIDQVLQSQQRYDKAPDKP